MDDLVVPAVKATTPHYRRRVTTRQHLDAAASDLMHALSLETDL